MFSHCYAGCFLLDLTASVEKVEYKNLKSLGCILFSDSRRQLEVNQLPLLSWLILFYVSEELSWACRPVVQGCQELVGILGKPELLRIVDPSHPVYGFHLTALPHLFSPKLNFCNKHVTCDFWHTVDSKRVFL